MVSGKRLIGQITLIKGNNVGRFHGRITMGLAGPFEYFPNARPATAAADMRALFPTHQCPVGSGFRWSSVVRKGRSCLPRNSRPSTRVLSLSPFPSLLSWGRAGTVSDDVALNSFCHPGHSSAALPAPCAS